MIILNGQSSIIKKKYVLYLARMSFRSMKQFLELDWEVWDLRIILRDALGPIGHPTPTEEIIKWIKVTSKFYIILRREWEPVPLYHVHVWPCVWFPCLRHTHVLGCALTSAQHKGTGSFNWRMLWVSLSLIQSNGQCF